MLLVVPLLVGLVQPATAGIIFGRKKDKPPSPSERVPELVNILKSDRDDDHRARAAEELRQYDPVAFPNIIPTLVDALQTDKKPTVRSEAAASLGKLRPISDSAGQALEQALANDTSMRVRMQARSALLGYHWAGYRTGKKGDPTPPLTTKEPAQADPNRFPPPVSTNRVAAEPPRLSTMPMTPAPTSPETPLVANPVPPVPMNPPVISTGSGVPSSPNPAPTGATQAGTILGSPRRMPGGPAMPQAAPVRKQEIKEQGPELGSPF
jgi:hypothetical protein